MNRAKQAVNGALIATMFLATTASAQSTNGPTLGIGKSGPDNPAVLQWASQTNEIYRIDYTVGLTNWTTAIDDLASQGTNTLWADLGSESAFEPRPSSTDPEAPYRFYRAVVTGYMSNDLPATITVSNISAGSVLTGLTNVLVGAQSESNLISGRLLLDGNEVAIDSGNGYDFPLETRFYPNGTHVVSVQVEDSGDTGTTGGDDPVPDPTSEVGASYATKSISVTFSNFLSDAHLKYKGYRPDLGQTQQVYATWASPRDWQVDITPADDTNTIYRTFTGSGTRVAVTWDGLDSNGQDLSPQRIAYVIYDLGQSSASMAAASASSETDKEAMMWWAQRADGSREAVPLAIYPPGFDMSGFVIFEAPQPKVQIESVVSANVESYGNEPNGPMDSGGSNAPFILYSTYKPLGRFGMLYQGHHPAFGSYPRPPRGAPFGQVTFATSSGFPWGKLKAPRRIANFLVQAFPTAGYPLGFIYADDQWGGSAIQKSSLGGSNIFNDVNLGLFVGHSAAGKENIVALGHPQTYVPVYNKGSDSFTWVGMNDMRFGSSNLKWVAFYSCNLFRDSAYRSFGCYSQMKNSGHLAITTDLHIMQSYATEVTVHPDMGKFWVPALIGGTINTSFHTVLGAWKFVCLKTQPVESAGNANYSRSVYWEECAGDHLYGYGSQTDPDPDHIQPELLEDDQRANVTP